MAPRSMNMNSDHNSSNPPDLKSSLSLRDVTELEEIEGIDRKFTEEMSSVVECGSQDSSDYQAFMVDCLGNKYSPIHDIPLQEDWSASFNIVCTVSIGSQDPFHCAIDEEFNPFVATNDLSEPTNATETFHWNHGIMPKTWGDWRRLETHHGGIPPTRNYPLEVIDISSRTPALGSVYSVKPLAAFSIVVKHEAEVELCWKVIAIDSQDPLADQLHDLSDMDVLLPGTLDDLKLWISSTQFQGHGDSSALFSLLNRRPASARETLSVIMQAHASWKLLIAELGIIVKSPVFSLAQDEPQVTFKDNEFEYLKASETIYEKAWAASSPEWKKEEEEAEEEYVPKKGGRHNRSRSMSFAFAEKKSSDALPEDEVDYLRRTPSLKETSKKWFQRTLSNFVGLRSSVDAKEMKELRSQKPRKTSNRRSLFKLSNSEAHLEPLKSRDALKDGEKSPRDNNGGSKSSWLKKERVMVQFSEAPKLFRQNTSFGESRRLTRMDTMPAPNSHTEAMEEFRSGLMRMDSMSRGTPLTVSQRRRQTNSMGEIMENLSFSDPDSPQAPCEGSENGEDIEEDLDSSAEQKIDLSHVDEQISRMEMEMESRPGDLVRAQTFNPEQPPVLKSLRNKYGSFSGSLVSPLPAVPAVSTGVSMSDPLLANKSNVGEDGFPEMRNFPRPVSTKKTHWSPAQPRVYKAVRGTGFSPKALPMGKAWPSVSATTGGHFLE